MESALYHHHFFPSPTSQGASGLPHTIALTVLGYGECRLAQGKPTNVDFQNPFMEPVEFSLQAPGDMLAVGSLNWEGYGLLILLPQRMHPRNQWYNVVRQGISLSGFFICWETLNDHDLRGKSSPPER